MTDWLPLLWSLLAGIGIGLFYFGGLWLTVRQLPSTRHPGLLVLVSFTGRTLISLLAFFIVIGGQWQRLIAALLGFILTRFILIRRIGSEETG